MGVISTVLKRIPTRVLVDYVLDGAKIPREQRAQLDHAVAKLFDTPFMEVALGHKVDSLAALVEFVEAQLAYLNTQQLVGPGDKASWLLSSHLVEAVKRLDIEQPIEAITGFMLNYQGKDPLTNGSLKDKLISLMDREDPVSYRCKKCESVVIPFINQAALVEYQPVLTDKEISNLIQELPPEAKAFLNRALTQLTHSIPFVALFGKHLSNDLLINANHWLQSGSEHFGSATSALKYVSAPTPLRGHVARTIVHYGMLEGNLPGFVALLTFFDQKLEVQEQYSDPLRFIDEVLLSRLPSLITARVIQPAIIHYQCPQCGYHTLS